MAFALEQHTLPHDGTIPGARGHKKQIIPKGTKVFCITYGPKFYWAAYLTEQQALSCMNSLQLSVDGKARRNIDLQAMLDFNFTSNVPKRIIREGKN